MCYAVKLFTVICSKLSLFCKIYWSGCAFLATLVQNFVDVSKIKTS